MNSRILTAQRMEKMNDYLAVCERAARAGGQVLMDWVGRFAAREKGPSDLVTDADLASQEVIRSILKSSFPTHGFVGEEGGPKGPVDAEFCWYVDPLDGTTNYVHQIPHYCVSIALARREVLLCGTVFDPISQECFTAQQGGGAFLNGKEIRVSDVKEMQSAVAAASFPPRLHPESRAQRTFTRDGRGPSGAAHRVGRAQPQLSRRGPVRRLLGRRHETLGHRRRRAHDRRSRWNRFQLRRRPRANGGRTAGRGGYERSSSTDVESGWRRVVR